MHDFQLGRLQVGPRSGKDRIGERCRVHLRINQSTVSRRIRALEQQCDQALLADWDWRVCDDFIISFERENDARRVMDVFPKRLGRFGLALHPDKTRLPRLHVLLDAKPQGTFVWGI